MDGRTDGRTDGWMDGWISEISEFMTVEWDKTWRVPILKIKHYAMKTYAGVDVEIHFFLTLRLVGVKWSALYPCRFIRGESIPSTHSIGGWVEPRAGLDDVERKIIVPLTGLEVRPLGRPANSPSLYRLRNPVEWDSFNNDPRNWEYSIRMPSDCGERWTVTWKETVKVWFKVSCGVSPEVTEENHEKSTSEGS
jgi:hypothetical protein